MRPLIIYRGLCMYGPFGWVMRWPHSVVNVAKCKDRPHMTIISSSTRVYIKTFKCILTLRIFSYIHELACICKIWTLKTRKIKGKPGEKDSFPEKITMTKNQMEWLMRNEGKNTNRIRFVFNWREHKKRNKKNLIRYSMIIAQLREMTISS